MEKPPIINPENGMRNEYDSLITAYRNVSDRIKAKQERFQSMPVDDKHREKIEALDEERHRIHLRLNKLGEQLGKNHLEIVVDILRKDGTLEEFGLPEFPVIMAEDMDDPGEGILGRVDFKDGKIRRHGERHVSRNQKRVGESGMYPDEALIVYGLDPIVMGTASGGIEIPNLDHVIRRERAAALAEALGARVVDICDITHHQMTLAGFGVAVIKDELEAAAGRIMAVPNAFRIGSEFYPQTEKARAERELVSELESVFERLTKPHVVEDYRLYPNERGLMKRLRLEPGNSNRSDSEILQLEYLEKIRQLRGQEAFEAAQKIYVDWLDKLAALENKKAQDMLQAAKNPFGTFGELLKKKAKGQKKF